jgi:hypothetical protein
MFNTPVINISIRSWKGKIRNMTAYGVRGARRRVVTFLKHFAWVIESPFLRMKTAAPFW